MESYSQPSSSAPLLGVLLAATLSVNKPHYRLESMCSCQYYWGVCRQACGQEPAKLVSEGRWASLPGRCVVVLGRGPRGDGKWRLQPRSRGARANVIYPLLLSLSRQPVVHVLQDMAA